jgi:hypothetical protein
MKRTAAFYQSLRGLIFYPLVFILPQDGEKAQLSQGIVRKFSRIRNGIHFLPALIEGQTAYIRHIFTIISPLCNISRGCCKTASLKNSAQKMRFDRAFQAVSRRILLPLWLLLCAICYCKFILQQPLVLE